MSGPALTVLTHRPHAPLRLYCLPPGGLGPEFYLPWCSVLPSSIELCAARLPGRGSLAGQLNVTDPRHLTAALADVIHAQGDARPFAVFGHCIGALLAFTTTHRLRRTHRRRPVLLAVSALPAPHQLGAHARGFGLRLTNGQATIADLIGPLPSDVTQDPDRLATAYTPLLADLLLVLQYRHDHEAPLDGELAIYGGEDDIVTPRDQLSAWNDLVATPTAVRLFPGGHSYLIDQAEALVSRLSNDLHAATRHTRTEPLPP